MNQYQIQSSSRRCSVTDAELKPGDRYYAALLADGGKLVRRDFSAQAWSGPPEGTIGFWAGKIPTQATKKPAWNDELLLDCFTHLAESHELEKLRIRYVLALLLMRRRRFRFEDVRREGSQEYLQVCDVKTNERYDVLDARLNEAELTAVQDEVFRVLGWE